MNIVVSARQVQEHLPASWAQMVAAMDSLSTGRTTLSCKHVVDGTPCRMLCSTHPGAGVLCERCSPHHIRRHSRDFETQCNECGVVGPLAQAFGLHVTVFNLDARDTRGCRRRITGDVFLLGFGACSVCWDPLRELVA